MLHSRVGSRPYPSKLDKAGNACHGLKLKLIAKMSKLGTKSMKLSSGSNVFSSLLVKGQNKLEHFENSNESMHPEDRQHNLF
jgi:hypothetical protein